MTVKPIRLEGLALEALEALPQPIWAYDRETLKFVWANDVAVGAPLPVTIGHTPASAATSLNAAAVSLIAGRYSGGLSSMIVRAKSSPRV